jgi:hypothetical protein
VLIGLLMLVVPIVIFLATIPVSHRMRPRLCLLYRIVGGFVVFTGSATSLYFAAYTGDQGGIAAYFFQMAVILVYALTSVLLVTANWLLQQRDMRNHEG